MKLHKLLLAAASVAIFSQPFGSFAQQAASKSSSSIKTLYVGSTLDGSIFSTAVLTSPNSSQSLGTLRYSYFFNAGFNMHYNFSRKVGVFAGLNIKNIGFIEKIKTMDSTVKRRVYALGVPVGIKFGDLKRKNFGFIGGGIDLPFNYKEKGFVKRNDKDKFNEWFSDRVPAVMPYLFAGFSVDPGFTVKFQYYPGNFLNTDYSETIFTAGNIALVSKPYAGYKVNLFLMSVGMDIASKKGKSHKGGKKNDHSTGMM